MIRFDQVIQSGLKYHHDMALQLIGSFIQRVYVSKIELDKQQHHNSLDLDQMFSNSFIYLLICLCLSSAVFLCELSIYLISC